MTAITPACEELVLGEMRRRAPERGMRKRLAFDLGTYESHISAYLLDKRHVPEVIAWRLLAQIRREDLELADKIEAELSRPSKLKECQ